MAVRPRIFQEIWNLSFLIISMLVAAQTLKIKDTKDQSPILTWSVQQMQPIKAQPRAPSLTKAFQMLQPEKILAVDERNDQRGIYAMRPASSIVQNQQHNFNRRVTAIKNKQIFGLLRGQAKPIGKKNELLGKNTKRPWYQIRKKLIATAKGQINKNANSSDMLDPSAKRQRLWYPGDQLGGLLPQIHEQGGIQRALPFDDKPMHVTEMKIGPGRMLTSNGRTHDLAENEPAFMHNYQGLATNGRTRTTNEIYSKLHRQNFSPKAPNLRLESFLRNKGTFKAKQSIKNDPKGYLGTVSLLLHQDGINEDINLGGTTLSSPYADTSFMYERPNTQITKGDYFGQLVPEALRQEQGYSRGLSKKNKRKPGPATSTVRSKQSNIEKYAPVTDKADGFNSRFAQNAMDEKDKYTDNARNGPLTNSDMATMAHKDIGSAGSRKGDNEGLPNTRVASSSLEQTDTENSRKEATSPNAVDPRWEKMQKEKDERWMQYQREREARWRNVKPGDHNKENMTGQSQGEGNQMYDINSGHINNTNSKNGANQRTNVDDYDYKYFTNQADTKGSYDYSTERKPSDLGYDRNTEEISPNGGSAGNIDVSLEKGRPTGNSREIKVGNQSKILNLEIVDKPEGAVPGAGTNKPEPDNGGVPEKGEPEKGGVPENGQPEKVEPEKGGIPEKGGVEGKGEPEKGGIPEKGGVQEKVEPEKGGIPEKGGVQEKVEPEKGGIPEKGGVQEQVEPEKGGIPEKGGVQEKVEPEKGGIPEKGGVQEKVEPEKGGIPEKGEPEKGCVPEKGGVQETTEPEKGCVPDKGKETGKGGLPMEGKGCGGGKTGPPEQKVPTEPNKEKCGKKPDKTEPPETVESLIEQSLLDKMEKKLASILSLMEYAGGIHTIEIISSGCDDPPANREDCNKALGTIMVDGDLVSENKFGFNIVVVDYPSFKVKTARTYDTNMDGVKSQKLSSFLMSLQGTNVILVAVKGDVAGALGQDVWDTLTTFGARPPFEKGRRASFAFIGCRGDCQVPWIQQVQRPAGKGPSTIQLIVGVNKEYVSFGGGGPVVFDAIKTVSKGSSMSEGYNAGLQTKFASNQVVVEQMAQAVPHLPHEMLSNKEIISDISGAKGQAEAASYLNRQEAGEIGLGKEVPMQAVDKTAPYGRGLHYTADSTQKQTNGHGVENLKGDGQNRIPHILEQNNAEKVVFGDSHNVMSFKKAGGETADGNMPNVEGHSLETIPTEAEADNEPFPEDAMSIANQVRPLSAAEIAQKMEWQNAEQAMKQQEASKMHSSQSEARKPDESGRIGHSENNEYAKNERQTGRHGDQAQDSKSQASLQPHNIKSTNENEISNHKDQSELVGNGNNNNAHHEREDLSSHNNNNNADFEGRKNTEHGEGRGGSKEAFSTKIRQQKDNSYINQHDEQRENPKAAYENTGVSSEKEQNLHENESRLKTESSAPTDNANKDFQKFRDSAYQQGQQQRIKNGDYRQVSDLSLSDAKGSTKDSQNTQYLAKNNEKDEGRFQNNMGKFQAISNRFRQQAQAAQKDTSLKNNHQPNDLKPDVNFKLDESQIETGPIHGENPRVTTSIANLKLNVSVNNKKVSSPAAQTMREEAKQPLPVIPKTKQNVYKSQQNSLNGNGDSSNKVFEMQENKPFLVNDEHRNKGLQEQTGSQKADASLKINQQPADNLHCKHCDIKPQVSFNLEASEMESGPSKCNGCGKNPKFTPTVDNLGLNMSVSNKIVAPTAVQPMKEESKVPLPVNPQSKENINDQQPSNLKGNGEISSKMFALQQNKLVLLHDAPSNTEIVNFAQDKQDQLATQKHNAERPDIGPAKFYKQNVGPNADSSSKDGSNNQDSNGSFSGTTQAKDNKDSTQSHINLSMNPKVESVAHEEGAFHIKYPLNTGPNGPAEKPVSSATDVPMQSSTSKFNLDNPNQSGYQAKPSFPNTPATDTPANVIDKNPNLPAVSRAHDSQDESKANNITSLVEIITKGMKALRESNVDIAADNKVVSKGNKEGSMMVTDDKTKDQQPKLGNNKEKGQQNKPVKEHNTNDATTVDEGNKQTSKTTKESDKIGDNSYGDHSSSNKLPDRSENGNKGSQQINGAEEFDTPKKGWHDKNCDKNPELCKGKKAAKGDHTGKSTNEKQSVDFEKVPQNGLSSSNGKSTKVTQECHTFYSLPDREKRRLTKSQITKYKKACLQHFQQKIEPLNVADIKNDDDDQSLSLNAAQKPRIDTEISLNSQNPLSTNFDKINLNSAKLKIASLLKQEALSKPNSDFHPGYTTMAFPSGAVLAEKKLATMPDTGETFTSRTARPDFSSMAGENNAKPSDMAFYFNQKNDQKEKDMLMRALPESHAVKTESNTLDSPYGGVYQMAENLLQKDYAMAYKVASSALDQRVANEQNRLNNEKLSLLAKRRLKKTLVNKPRAKPKSKIMPQKPG